MNLFTSDLFTPAMAEDFATRAPRSYRTTAFARRYGRGTRQAMAPAAAPMQLNVCTIETVGDEHMQLDYALAA